VAQDLKERALDVFFPLYLLGVAMALVFKFRKEVADLIQLARGDYELEIDRLDFPAANDGAYVVINLEN